MAAGPGCRQWATRDRPPESPGASLSRRPAATWVYRRPQRRRLRRRAKVARLSGPSSRTTTTSCSAKRPRPLRRRLRQRLGFRSTAAVVTVVEAAASVTVATGHGHDAVSSPSVGWATTVCPAPVPDYLRCDCRRSSFRFQTMAPINRRNVRFLVKGSLLNENCELDDCLARWYYIEFILIHFFCFQIGGRVTKAGLEKQMMFLHLDARFKSAYFLKKYRENMFEFLNFFIEIIKS